MRRPASFDHVSRTVSVAACETTQAVQRLAESKSLFYPVDLASRGSSQIGGNVATNAGGIRVIRYGLTRNWVAGLKVVTGTGEFLDLNKGLAKNATGYDFRHLFIGSEGTLGFVVEATLQLIDSPAPQQVLVMGVSSFAAVTQIFTVLRQHLVLSAFEFFSDRALMHVLAAGVRRPFDSDAPFYVLAEFDADDEGAFSGYERCQKEGLATEGVISRSEAQAAELWALRERVSESLARYRPYKNDISVRIALLPAFLSRVDSLLKSEYSEFEVIWFGHVVDGNVHINIVPPIHWPHEKFQIECYRVTHKLGEVLLEFGGSISAEHGIGLLKLPYLRYTRTVAEVELMRQVKKAFDPAGIMNPGKLLPP
jgi:FAD/FMN-containing dehydrogenase